MPALTQRSALLAAAAVHAATPEGPELQIHTHTTGHQSRSAVAGLTCRPASVLAALGADASELWERAKAAALQEARRA